MLPSTRKPRELRIPDIISVQAKDQQLKARQKKNFDNQYDISEWSSSFSPGDTIWIPDQSSDTQVSTQVDQRSYELATEDGTFQRNWKDLILLPDSTTTNTSSDDLNMKDSTDLNTTDSDIVDPVYCLSTRPAILLEFTFSHTSILALLMSNNTKIKQVLWIA